MAAVRSGLIQALSRTEPTGAGCSAGKHGDVGVREKSIEAGGYLGAGPNEWWYHILNGGRW